MIRRSRSWLGGGDTVLLSLALFAVGCAPDGVDSQSSTVRALHVKAPGTSSMPAPAVARRVVNENAIARVHALAQRLREQEGSSDRASAPRAFHFSPDGEITDDFDPMLKPGHAAGHGRGTRDGSGENGLNAPNAIWAGRTLFSTLGTPVASATSQTAGFGYFTRLPPPPNSCSPSPCPDPPQQQQVKFIGQDQHVYELFFTPGHVGWSFNDLTKLTSTTTSPTPLAKGTLAAFQTSFNRQQHVMYIGVDNDVHELFFDGSTWHHQDLTQLTASPQVAANARALTGYQTTFNNQEHVDFVSADGHVRELFFDTSWHANDLTQSARVIDASTPLAVTSSALTGYQTTFNNQHHVDYISADGHVRELFLSVGSTQWNPRDLTLSARQITASTPLALTTTALAAYQTTFNNQHHVNFIATNGHVFEFFIGVGSTQWRPMDLTNAASAVSPNAASSLAGYQTTFNNQQHVDFIDANGHIVELFFAGGTWRQTDLTTSAGIGGVQARTTALDGYATTNGPNQQHVNFISTDNHVRELFLNDGGTQWTAVDLTATGQIPWVTAVGTWQVPRVGQPLWPADALPGDVSLTDDGWESVTWVGIDGNNIDNTAIPTNDVLQAGTKQVLIEGGDTDYSAWFEWFPDTDNTISGMPTSPGDTFTATISYVGARGFIVLANVTTGTGFSIGLDPPENASFAGRCIEWIMETPTAGLITGQQITVLPTFTPVTFTQASGTDSVGAVRDPSDPSGFTDTIVRPDFFGANFAQTRTTTAANQETIEFVDWYDNDLSQIAAASAAAGRLVGFQTGFNNQQHIVYIGTDAHIHELFFPDATNRWQHTDLTTLTSSPSAAANSALTGYQTTFDRQEHIDFVSADGHVRELWFDTSWHPHDLTADARTTDASTPLAVAASALNGYETTFNNQQHVDFISADGHVRELWFDISIANRWNHHDLTVDARLLNGATPLAVTTTALDGYQTTFNNQQHVNFISSNSHVNELWYDNAWHWNDLTSAATGAPNAVQATSLAAFQTTFNNQQHVIFFAAGGQVFELVFDTTWKFNNLSALANVTGVVASNRALDGYQTTFNNQMHVDFLSTGDNHVRELFFDSSWHARDLTTVPNGPLAQPASATSRLTGYQSFKPIQNPPAGVPPTFDNQHHVDYISADGHVHELIHGP
jgi:hypothetical protein